MEVFGLLFARGVMVSTDDGKSVLSMSKKKRVFIFQNGMLQVKIFLV